MSLLVHGRALNWQKSAVVLQMVMARQHRTVNRTLGKVPIEIEDS